MKWMNGWTNEWINESWSEWIGKLNNKDWKWINKSTNERIDTWSYKKLKKEPGGHPGCFIAPVLVATQAIS